MKWTKRDTLEVELLELPAEKLANVLTGPTLFDFSRDGQSPLFISVLLHGNEISGWDAIRTLLKTHVSKGTVPSLLLLVGNVVAARQRVRFLDEQRDFNRIWEENEPGEYDWTHEVIREVQARNPWFTLDVHNNTCPNPHHTVLTDNNPIALWAAKKFSDTAIYAHHPKGLLARRCSSFCPAITIEVGIPSEELSTIRARDFISVLMDHSKESFSARDELVVYRNTIRVVIENASDMDTSKMPMFDPVLKDWNFKSLECGTEVARMRPSGNNLIAFNEHGIDVSSEYFQIQHDAILLKQDVILSMYTQDSRIAHQDCVCYFLEPYELGNSEPIAS